jgi:hypothetical protein
LTSVRSSTNSFKDVCINQPRNNIELVKHLLRVYIIKSYPCMGITRAWPYIAIHFLANAHKSLCFCYPWLAETELISTIWEEEQKRFCMDLDRFTICKTRNGIFARTDACRKDRELQQIMCNNLPKTCCMKIKWPRHWWTDL